MKKRASPDYKIATYCCNASLVQVMKVCLGEACRFQLPGRNVQLRPNQQAQSNNTKEM